MSWILVVEDQTPDQTALTTMINELFPPGPGRPATLMARVAGNASRALELLGLDQSLAGVNVPDAWDHLPQALRDELSRTPCRPELYAVTCDLEIRPALGGLLHEDVGINLVKLLFHWRSKQRADFRLVVVSQFAEANQGRLNPFCDELRQKIG